MVKNVTWGQISYPLWAFCFMVPNPQSCYEIPLSFPLKQRRRRPQFSMGACWLLSTDCLFVHEALKLGSLDQKKTTKIPRL